MTRKPNQDEWTILTAGFPGLVWKDVWITDEMTSQYN